MKSLLLFLILTSPCMSCNNNSNNASATNDSSNRKSATNEDTKEERNKQVVEASTEAFSKHDVDAVARDFSPNVLDYGDYSRSPVRGVDSLKYVYYTIFQSLSGYER